MLLIKTICVFFFSVICLFYDCLLMQAPGTRWMKVIENLDYEELDIPNMEAFLFFMMVVRNICKVCYQTG